MKYLLFILLFCQLGVEVNEPPHVPLKITELRTNSWYNQTMQSWLQYIENNPTDESAWVQYYRSAAFANQSAEKLQSIQSEASELFPDSYISHYLTFKTTGWSAEGIAHLEKAFLLNSDENFALEDKLILSELKRTNSRGKWSEKVFNSGLIHSSTLNYNYNLLMSVNEGGILLTDALHTTIPIWILQDVMNVRKDVTILNLELARQREDYLNAILGSKGLNASIGSLLSVNDWDIYYALTLPREQLSAIENRLYVVGLASTNGSESFDHFEELRNNVEKKFLLDYLSIDFNGEPQTATGKVLSSNYIVPLMLLKDFYDQLENQTKSNELKGQILGLAERSQIRARVELLLNAKKSPPTFKVVDFDIKALDKHLMKIKEGIYASEIELSNREFWFYMEYLRENGYEELYQKGLIDLSEYDEVTKALLSNYHYSPANAQMEERKRPGGSYFDYPVMDITYEVAKDYCEWLTVQYNAHPKRKYKKVLFRLPSREEWTMAALGNSEFTSWTYEENNVVAWAEDGEKMTYSLKDEKVSYPWYHTWKMRNSITNEKDCYLANVKVPEEVTCAAGIKGDGYNFTSPVATYFSNNFGLYDVIGNVAEMTNEEGVAMGGSWRHLASECTITSVNNYEGRDLAVGLRLFMEIIEE
ncbi:formylglycine-generating enzyme family protein [Ekhidna sp.]|uniref:formylglycine-generating enzyme family protein n=1 Tax=Ekhidna sp. TaxID=2608089 RepID=UPI003C7E6E21